MYNQGGLTGIAPANQIGPVHDPNHSIWHRKPEVIYQHKQSFLNLGPVQGMLHACICHYCVVFYHAHIFL